MSSSFTQVSEHRPDPSQGFGNSSIGSNIFQVIEKFFTNTKAPVCGSFMLILVKRYPNEVDISGIVSLIRAHHAILHVVTSATPSGGTQAKAMYNVASKTNGVGAFGQDEELESIVSWFPLLRIPYPVYVINLQASGSKSITLPQFLPSTYEDHWVTIAFQDHWPLDSFQNVCLSWASLNSWDHNSYQITKPLPQEGGASYAARLFDFLQEPYEMTFSYVYSNANVESLQIRIYSGTPPAHWFPYSD